MVCGGGLSRVFLGALLLVQCAWVPDAAAVQPEEKLNELRGRIREEARVVGEIETRKTTLLGSLQSIDKNIRIAAVRLKRSEKQIAELSGKIRDLRKEIKTLEDEIKKQNREAGRRLEAYYRLGKDGILPVLFSDLSLPEKLRSLEALRTILDADWEGIRRLHDLQSTKQNTEAHLEERLAEERRLREEVRQYQKKWIARRREKDRLLFDLEHDAKLHKQLLEEMQTSAEGLDALLREKAKKAAGTGEAGMSGSDSRSIISHRGQLAWPVDGAIFRKFGKYSDPVTHAGVVNNGIDIRTREEQPVRSVWGGSVAFADWFRGYGKLLIVDHGNKTYSVLSHMSSLTKREGEPVETGEIVGYAGDTGSLEGYLVHFEIWENGSPQDPLLWIRER